MRRRKYQRKSSKQSTQEIMTTQLHNCLLARKLPLLFERRITMVTRDQKYEVFRALHERPEAFVIPNPWNAGTARILTTLGFEALATTSAGYAFAVGRRDSAAGLTREGILDNAKDIV